MIPPPETLIFQNLPIHWVGGDFFWPLGSAIFGSIFVWIFLSFMRKSKVEKILPKHNTDTVITENDISRNDFETYALNILKKKLESIYLPKTTSTHTRKDIRNYITDTMILTVFSELESSEYQGRALLRAKREEIMDVINGV